MTGVALVEMPSCWPLPQHCRDDKGLVASCNERPPLMGPKHIPSLFLFRHLQHPGF